MRTTARVFGVIPAGASQAVALALLAVAVLSAASSGCGTGSEALPSNLPPPAGGGALIITTTTMEDGVVNRSYSKTLDTTGGTPPLGNCSFSAGTPPPGLLLVPSGRTCIAQGTPTMAGTFNFTVRALDIGSVSDTQDYTLVIRNEFTITGPAPDPLPAGVEDAAYNFMFTVTTNTVVGPNDVGQAAENGNGPLTQCGLTGLPAGMNAATSNITANSCQITISGTPNIGATMPSLSQLTLTVTDSGIPATSTPPGIVMQLNIDLTIHAPLAFDLVTDPAGGSFSDAASGGNAPAAVTGRRYGAPSRDLLFRALGGRPPFTWMVTSLAPTPIACAQEGAGNVFLRCNSGGANVTGATATLAVQVSDAGNAALGTLTTATDNQGHAGHVIAVHNEIAIDNQFLTNGVRGQAYSVTLTCDNNTGLCGGTGNLANAQALYTWSETGGPAHANIAVSGTNVPQPGDGLYSGTPAAGAANQTNLMPTITVTDNGNDTTPNCQTAGTCPTFTPTYHIFAPTAIVDAAEARVQFYTTDTGAPVFSSAVDLDASSTPVRAAFSPNGTIIVVGDDGEGELSLINLVTGAVTPVDTSGGAGNARGVAIGPKTSPLANPDSWVTYVANPTGGGAGNVDIIDIEPGTLGTVVDSVALTQPNDVALTPTFAGPETRAYVLLAGSQVCAIDAEPSSPGFGTLIDLTGSIGTPCIDTSGVAGNAQEFIEAAGSFVFGTRFDSMGGTGTLYAIDVLPGSPTRDAIVDELDLTADGCDFPLDLRANPAGTEVWVACGVNNLVTIVDSSDPTNLSVVTTIATGMNTSPQDIAFNIDGSLALVTLALSDEVLPVDPSGPTAGTAVSTTAPMGNANDITFPEGIDHIRDPQLNAL
ncbi:MAG: hypothetical protein ACRD5I_04675, partial [Candidatus Acidiferrales bacterium]